MIVIRIPAERIGVVIGPGGEIRLKIDSTTTDYIEIQPSTITLTVNP